MNRFFNGRIFSVAAAALLIAGCTSTASRITTTYYNISGTSGTELDREIATKGPMKGHALASAAISFVPVSIEYAETADSCRFHSAKFRIEANVTLPRWREHLVSPNRDLRLAWRYLSRYARQHEEEHIRIAEKYSRKIGAELMALPAKRDCDRLEKSAEQVLKKNRIAHDREQRAFDASEQKRLANLFEE